MSDVSSKILTARHARDFDNGHSSGVQEERERCLAHLQTAIAVGTGEAFHAACLAVEGGDAAPQSSDAVSDPEGAAADRAIRQREATQRSAAPAGASVLEQAMDAYDKRRGMFAVPTTTKPATSGGKTPLEKAMDLHEQRMGGAA